MIKALAVELGFPEEAILSLSADYQKMEGQMDAARAALYAEGDYKEMIRALAEEVGVHPYAADMVFALYCALPLREKYREKGLPDTLFIENMEDLRFKLMECKRVYDVWGSFVAVWFRGFYLMKRFKLGRLQYEQIGLKYNYRHLKEGDSVLKCHIPSCGPVTRESVLDSLKKAYEFYGYEGLMPVVCNSWMLYPPHYEVYPEGGNMRSFFELFEILSTKEDPENKDLWRITNRMDDVIPEDTTLQRRFKAYLEAGNCMGSGYGILLFDGQKIIK
ncbi:MAG: DUF5596 domain-containing protein [Clostridia bacterium]|nr:DUF5596 domain-containing protein [Clostridia bacterium]